MLLGCVFDIYKPANEDRVDWLTYISRFFVVGPDSCRRILKVVNDKNKLKHTFPWHKKKKQIYLQLMYVEVPLFGVMGNQLQVISNKLNKKYHE
jgi:hypothetical protein